MGIRQAASKHWAITAAIGSLAFVGLVAVALFTFVPSRDSGHNEGGGSSTVMANDRFETMLTSGELHAMLQQHQEMMQAMRVDTSPQMVARMDNDPMWQMLQSGELIDLMEQHQQAIDQLLGK